MRTITAEASASFKRNLLAANDVRVAHGRVRETVKDLGPVDGPRLVARLLQKPTGLVSLMPVGRLLRSVAGVGPARVNRMLLRAGMGGVPVSPSRRIGELSPRQREELVEALHSDLVRRREAA